MASPYSAKILQSDFLIPPQFSKMMGTKCLFAQLPSLRANMRSTQTSSVGKHHGPEVKGHQNWPGPDRH